MNSAAARELGRRMSLSVSKGDIDGAFAMVEARLAERIPFPTMGLVGAGLGDCPMTKLDQLLDRIAATAAEGGWVLIGAALKEQLRTKPLAGLAGRCRGYIEQADVWCASDILAERVPGPSLLVRFKETLDILGAWSEDPNRWVRRAVGVAIHHWAKNAAGRRDDEARRLLTLLEPLFEEREIDAVKGVGWGLKTLGKHYPDLLGAWLVEQVGVKAYRALMLQKALTYLPARAKGDVKRAAAR
ncbi:MAG TPA: DNA alkylation repair protein [Polyangiaceae bacterium]|nr:DNA alkylation repair protein [Polyangiaceae bacterium]